MVRTIENNEKSIYGIQQTDFQHITQFILFLKVNANQTVTLYTKHEVFFLEFLLQMWTNLQKTADLFTFTKEILNENMIFQSQNHICDNHTKLFVLFLWWVNHFSYY